jgi:RNA polymerase sigma factor (sigma-70 family)
MEPIQIVYVVDDDAAMRESMALMLELAGFRVKSFDSARAFLAACSAQDRGCLVLDQRMPDMSGLELQQELVQRGLSLPIIFLSGYGDIPTTVRAVKNGAMDFLEKPVAKEMLLERIEQALAVDREQHATAAEEERIRRRYAELTPREREVFRLATRGLPNKEIARELAISPRTVENHRARVMEKMQADNIVGLCGMATVCLPPETPSSAA